MHLVWAHLMQSSLSYSYFQFLLGLKSLDSLNTHNFFSQNETLSHHSPGTHVSMHV
jgi:hypothetical protein